MRQLQDRFDSRRLADRLDEKLSSTVFSTQDREFIESRTLFFLSTAGADRQPDCFYKGGAPGFVRVPREGHALPVPAWKRFDAFSDVLPRGDAEESEPM